MRFETDVLTLSRVSCYNSIYTGPESPSVYYDGEIIKNEACFLGLDSYFELSEEEGSQIVIVFSLNPILDSVPVLARCVNKAGLHALMRSGLAKENEIRTLKKFNFVFHWWVEEVY